MEEKENNFLIDMWDNGIFESIDGIDKFVCKENMQTQPLSLNSIGPLLRLGNSEEISFTQADKKLYEHSVFNFESQPAEAATNDTLNGSKRRTTKHTLKSTANDMYQELSKTNVDDHLLVEPFLYGEKSGPLPDTEWQPFTMIIHPQVGLVCDLHSHLSQAEVIGLLFGWIEKGVNGSPDAVHVQVALPGTAVEEGESSHTDVELDAATRLKLIQIGKSHSLDCVGWYHSHPKFKPNPSSTDINQHDRLMRERENAGDPFVALIVSPFDEERREDQACHQWFTVTPYGPLNRKIPLPMGLTAQYVSLSVHANKKNDQYHELAIGEMLLQRVDSIRPTPDFYSPPPLPVTSTISEQIISISSTSVPAAAASDKRKRRKTDSGAEAALDVSSITESSSASPRAASKTKKVAKKVKGVKKSSVGAKSKGKLTGVSSVGSATESTVAGCDESVEFDFKTQALAKLAQQKPAKAVASRSVVQLPVRKGRSASKVCVVVEEVSETVEGEDGSAESQPDATAGVDQTISVIEAAAHCTKEVVELESAEYKEVAEETELVVVAADERSSQEPLWNGAQAAFEKPIMATVGATPEEPGLSLATVPCTVDLKVENREDFANPSHTEASTASVVAKAGRKKKTSDNIVDSAMISHTAGAVAPEAVTTARRSGRPAKASRLAEESRTSALAEIVEVLQPVSELPKKRRGRRPASERLSFGFDAGTADSSFKIAVAPVAVAVRSSLRAGLKTSLKEAEEREIHQSVVAQPAANVHRGSRSLSVRPVGGDELYCAEVPSPLTSGKRKYTKRAGASAGKRCEVSSCSHGGSSAKGKKGKKRLVDNEAAEGAYWSEVVVKPPTAAQRAKFKKLSETDRNNIHNSLLLSLHDTQYKSTVLARALLKGSSTHHLCLMLIIVTLGMYYSRYGRRTDLRSEVKNGARGSILFGKVRKSAETWARLAGWFDTPTSQRAFSDGRSSTQAVEINSSSEASEGCSDLGGNLLDRVMEFLVACWEDYAKVAKAAAKKLAAQHECGDYL